MKTLSTTLASLLTVLASDINTELEKLGTNERIMVSYDSGSRVANIERITRSSSDRHHVDSVYVLINATWSEAHHYLVGFQNALTFIPVKA